MFIRKRDKKIRTSPTAIDKEKHSKFKSFMHCVSVLLLPLALGVFTIVITFQQQSAAKQQRDEDRQAAALQREQDQNASQQLRDLERYLDEQRYENALFDNYIQEMGQLLEKYNGSLKTNEVAATLTRIKTLNLFRQLDSQRNVRAIQFLFEAKQLTDTQDGRSIDLSTAILPNIDFRDIAVNRKQLHQLSLAGIFLRNATFIGIEMNHLNFSRIQFLATNFSTGQLYNGSFEYSSFYHANFSSSYLFYINFAFATFNDANFSNASISKVNFSCTQMDHIDFSHTQFDNVELSSGEFKAVDFIFGSIRTINLNSSILSNINFSHIKLINGVLSSVLFVNGSVSFSHLFNLQFSYSKLQKVDFSFSWFDNGDFLSASLKHVQFSHGRLLNSNFRFAKLDNVDFSSSELSYPVFWVSKLLNINFSSAILIFATFRDSEVYFTNFRQVTCLRAQFGGSTLKNSDFRYSNVKHALFVNAHLEGVNFTLANLYKTDFTNANITDAQLLSALSIQDAILPNGTLADDTNLINNGKSNCASSPIHDWSLSGSNNIAKSISSKSRKNCRLTLTLLSTNFTMHQRVNLSDKWDSTHWPFSKAVLRVNMSLGVSMELRGINNDNLVLNRQFLNYTQTSITLVLSDQTRLLEVFIWFNMINNNVSVTEYWFEDVHLFMIYGTHLESLRVIPNIPANARWSQNGVTVAGGNGNGNATNQLSFPEGLSVDDDQTVIITDCSNDRVLQWKKNDRNGQVVAGGNGKGNRLDQLNGPVGVLIDKETDSLIICDRENQRIVQWSRHTSTMQGEILISNTYCAGLALDDQRYLYVADTEKHDVRRYELGNEKGVVVAGGNGLGAGLNQLNSPTYVLVDQQQNVYVSDQNNHRVMKWNKDTKEGIVAAGTEGQGNAPTELNYPYGLLVDTLGTLYVVDSVRDCIIRWKQGAKEGTIIIGGNGLDAEENKLSNPCSLSFDRYGNIYVVDSCNNRVQRFSLQ